MINNYDRSGVQSAADQQSADQTGLAAFDGHTVAVILPAIRHGQHSTTKTVLRGRAVYVRDDCVGNALRIELLDDQLGYSVLLLSEQEWDGRIIPDFHYGCDFSLVFS